MNFPTAPLASLVALASTLVAAPPEFEAETVDSDIEIGYGLALADVDGDGSTDIVIADKREFRWYESPAWHPHVLAKNLTLRDNVCVAARDLDGDGKAEIAVGGQWNPGETSDPASSGAVFYLERPEDPRTRWKSRQLPHDPTVHRMRWFKDSAERYALAVLPLHGEGNRGGEGKPVEISVFPFPFADGSAAGQRKVATGLHKTHNFDVAPVPDGSEQLVIGGAEGTRRIPGGSHLTDEAAGEVRVLGDLIATVEPMHGSQLAVQEAGERRILAEGMGEGHALAIADILGIGRPQVIVGWRKADSRGKVGIRLFDPESGEDWPVDTDTMACEDLAVADLDADGDLDIVASGRATHNLVIYWNRTKP